MIRNRRRDRRQHAHFHGIHHPRAPDFLSSHPATPERIKNAQNGAHAVTASAGVALATALASLYTHHPVRRDTAMTGEITLTGLVLPVGGIKEKVLAAHRAGIRHVILPGENQKDLRDIPDSVRRELKFTFADRMDDVLAAAIPEVREQVQEMAAT